MLRHERGQDAAQYFDEALRILAGGRSDFATRVPVTDLRAKRWDPAYWSTAADHLTSSASVPLQELGTFIEHITYGPILTGERARRADRERSGDVRVVGLREIRRAGLDLRSAKRVGRNSARDPARCRLRRGDLVLARSGAGCLMKNRVAVFNEKVPATVSCFVDLVRLKGIPPGYAMLCMHSRIVKEQVRRLANGVGTPNLSFGEIRSLLIPRLGKRLESRLARTAASIGSNARKAAREGKNPVSAARALEAAVSLIDNASLGEDV